MESIEFTETELYNKMEDNIDAAESADMAAKSVSKPMITGVLSEKECTVQNCQLRLAIPKLERQIAEKLKEVRNLTEENENYRNALEKSIPIERREQVFIKATKDHLVQVILTKYKDLEVQLKQKDLEIKEVRQYANQVAEEKNEYLSTLEADKNLKDKYCKLKIIEQQTIKLLAQQEDAQVRFNRYDSEYKNLKFKTDKLVGIYNEYVVAYAHVTKLMKEAKMVAKGFKIELVPEKKKGFFSF